MQNVLYDPEKCWGCGLCANGCPSGAIVMKKLNEGFLANTKELSR
jgi:NAD-dependent dihydropyrimidine dehydrogenase PreA subunit